MLKIAILESSHWHAPLYFPGLVRDDVAVVAVSDASNFNGNKVAERFGAKYYSSYEDLLDGEKVDLAFAFGSHAQMPQIAENLIKRGIPFSLEKPCGMNANDVERLRDLASAHSVYVAVPLIFRLSDLLGELRRLEASGRISFNHLSFRFIAGLLSRYPRSGSPWMLDRNLAGGGCTINLAVHFIDLLTLLTGERIVSVASMMSNKCSGEDVEDYSLLALTTQSGTVATIETGYTFPSDAKEQRDFSFSISSNQYYIKSCKDAFQLRDHNNIEKGTQTRAVRLETDEYYPIFVEHVISSIKNSEPPIAGLDDVLSVMRVVDAAYQSAQNDGLAVRVTSRGQRIGSN
jgi:predicted dehydrogenase